jgi:hypothetical protein
VKAQLLRTRSAAALLALAALSGVVPRALGAQDDVNLLLGGRLGFPKGEFAQNAGLAVGIGGAAIWSDGGIVGFRADLNVSIYGSPARAHWDNGANLETTDAIVGGSIGAQLGVPGPTVRPFLGGTFGFSNFNTTAHAEVSTHTGDGVVRSTYSIGSAFSKTAFVGLYVPLRMGRTMLEISVQHTWHGEGVEYLTRESIDGHGLDDLSYTPHRSRADILTVTVGAIFRPTLSRW